MKRKPTKKRTRSQGRKVAVVIPPLPELSAHADAIRMLARRSFDDIVEIGRRLVRCRELLKHERQWLAWLEAEFSWSRRTADRFIDLFRAKDKVRNLRTLPMAALYLLARASPTLVRKIEHDIAAGEPLSLRDIQQQARAERGVITLLPSSSESPRPYLNITDTAPRRAPSKRRSLLSGDFAVPAFRVFETQLALFERWLAGHEPREIAAAAPPQRHTFIIEDADAIITFLNELKRALWERSRPRLVSDGDDNPAA